MSLILPDISKNSAIVCCKGREQYVLVFKQKYIIKCTGGDGGDGGDGDGSDGGGSWW